MIEANEINSTFYALRLLSHGLDTSQIEVTNSEDYPASEFSKEEQEQALKIIHDIEHLESISFDQLNAEKIHFYLAALADRIEELANSDLANAGYAVELTALSLGEPTQVEVPLARDDFVPAEGTIIDVRPNAFFKVQLDNTDIGSDLEEDAQESHPYSGR